MNNTYSYVVLEVSAAAYREIGEALQAAGYQHVFHQEGSRLLIDMHGIALAAKVTE
jgi:hypothetical protein